jgi:hypothetical protein
MFPEAKKKKKERKGVKGERKWRLVERGREGRGGEFDQSTLDAYMEKSQ